MGEERAKEQEMIISALSPSILFPRATVESVKMESGKFTYMFYTTILCLPVIGW